MNKNTNRWHWHFVAAITEDIATTWILKNEQNVEYDDENRIINGNSNDGEKGDEDVGVGDMCDGDYVDKDIHIRGRFSTKKGPINNAIKIESEDTHDVKKLEENMHDNCDRYTIDRDVYDDNSSIHSVKYYKNNEMKDPSEDSNNSKNDEDLLNMSEGESRGICTSSETMPNNDSNNEIKFDTTTEIPYSFSVSFWWGRRILKAD